MVLHIDCDGTAGSLWCFVCCSFSLVASLTRITNKESVTLVGVGSLSPANDITHNNTGPYLVQPQLAAKEALQKNTRTLLMNC